MKVDWILVFEGRKSITENSRRQPESRWQWKMTEDFPKYDSELVIFYSLSLPSSTPHPCTT